MTNLRPYWKGEGGVVEGGGIGLTGECAECGQEKDFVVSEGHYMALAKAKLIRYE